MFAYLRKEFYSVVTSWIIFNYSRWLGTSVFVLFALAFKGSYHRYLIYTRWRIPRCGQVKIEARSQALVIPTELTRSMIICVCFIAEMEKVDNKSSFMQLKSI